MTGTGSPHALASALFLVDNPNEECIMPPRTTWDRPSLMNSNVARSLLTRRIYCRGAVGRCVSRVPGQIGSEGVQSRAGERPQLQKHDRRDVLDYCTCAVQWSPRMRLQPDVLCANFIGLFTG